MTTFEVGIQDPNKANLFLRALWAILRERFGKCAWNYCPWKEGNKQTITFGFADVGEYNLRIGVTYKQKGSIDTIWFDSSTDDGYLADRGLTGRLKDAVDSAVTNASKPKVHVIQTAVKCLHLTVAAYQGLSFSITPISERLFLLSLHVTSFDNFDATTQAISLVQHILNILSVETNSAYWLAEKKLDASSVDEVSEVESFVEDPDWLEDRPVKGKTYLISSEGKNLIEAVIKPYTLLPQLKKLLKACQHFHTARKYAAQITDYLEVGEWHQDPNDNRIYHANIATRFPDLQLAGQLGASHAEITGTLYISALEVASEIGAPKSESCSECGQLKYQISRRVYDLMTRVGGEFLGHIASDYYRQRSRFLHAGELLSQDNYMGTSLPQLDPSSETGCIRQTASPCHNLLEYSGLCMRKVLKEVLHEINKLPSDSCRIIT